MNKEAISIKGTINGLVICVNQNLPVEELIAELEAKVSAQPGFFKNAKFKIYWPDNNDQQKLQALETAGSNSGMRLSLDIKWPYPEQAASSQQLRATEQVIAAQQEIAATTMAASPKEGSAGPVEDTLLIQRNLRSGQNLYYHGNMVILGDVNPGAEICAGGDIVVMGSLRGIAHAGASGNTKAVILAYRLQPTQLRIADKITRPPEKDLGANIPELARLSDNQMVIEPYRSQKMVWDSL